MVLSKREKYIAIGTVAAVALLAFNSLVYEPYVSASQDLHDQLAKANSTLGENKALFSAQKNRQATWNAMLAQGLRADDSTVSNRTLQLIQNWARSAGITLNSINSDRAPTAKGFFSAINFSVEFSPSGDEAMGQIARFLYSIETASVPVRLSNLHIQSTKDGTNELTVKMVISALYVPAGDSATSTELQEELEGM